MRDCTEQQKKFVEEYLACGNASKAYRRAYNCANWKNPNSIEVQASRTLRKPWVAALVEAGRAQACRAAGVSAARLIDELAAVAFARIDHYLSWSGTENSVRLKEQDEITPEQMAAIKHVEVKFSPDGSRTLYLNLYDKVDALDKLARILGLYKDGPQFNLNTDAVFQINFLDGKGLGNS